MFFLLVRTHRFEEVGGEDQKPLFTSGLLLESCLTTVNFKISNLKKTDPLGAIVKSNEVKID